ncbi:hypothetical protein ACTZWT_23190 [Rhodopseudomonas sp. NSM]|uniref:hypothetical protein n=1 Tax=Rhodopseudomonas sp. NSM TaxID=3457630 RepID=UPI004035EAA6
MTGKTLKEMRDLAKRHAELGGHRIKRWNRQNGLLYYTAICEKCRAEVRVYSQAVDQPLEESLKDDGKLIARDHDRYWTGHDYNFADGLALMKQCDRS